MATIGIDVTALSTSASGGIGTSQYATMRALAGLETPHRFVMYAATPPVAPFEDRPLDLPWPLRLGTGATTRSNIMWMQTGVNRMLAEDGVDLFWSPRHVLPFRAKGIARVATIQDFWHLHFPEQQPLVNRTLNRALIDRIMEVADHLVTTSQATADDAIGHYGVAPEQISVVPLGVDGTVFRPADPTAIEDARRAMGLTKPYLLSLDVFNPRKNFGAVLRAFAALPEAVRERVDLLGIGRRRATATDADPVSLAASLGIAERVRIHDDIDAGALVTLYSGALALVYPSVYEGFGMPVLEAMACGCPVITSDRSSLPEVAGGAAVLVDPDDPAAIAAAIGRLVGSPDETASLVASGLARAEAATWEHTARGMLDVFDRVLEART